MQTIGNQSRRPDPTTDPNPVPGHQLIADEPDHGSARDRPQMRDLFRADQPRNDSYAASNDDKAIIATTNSPPRSSARPYPYVNRFVGARRASAKATSNGTAVSASATLCNVSPSRATDPGSTTTAPCTAAVKPNPARLSSKARRPAASASNTSSTWSP